MGILQRQRSKQTYPSLRCISGALLGQFYENTGLSIFWCFRVLFAWRYSATDPCRHTACL